jgi:hypothetical protein
MPDEVIVRLVGGRDAIPVEATVSLGDAFIDPLTKAGSLADWLCSAHSFGC